MESFIQRYNFPLNPRRREILFTYINIGADYSMGEGVNPRRRFVPDNYALFINKGTVRRRAEFGAIGRKLPTPNNTAMWMMGYNHRNRLTPE